MKYHIFIFESKLLFAPQVNEPATMPVAPVISQPGPPMEQPTSGYNNAGAGYGAGGGGGYGTGSSFNSQPPRQYGNEENQQKQVCFFCFVSTFPALVLLLF